MSSRKEQKEQARQERLAVEQAAASAQTRGRRLKIIGIVIGGAAIIVLAAVLISLGGGGSETVEEADAIEARLKGIPQEGITLGKEDAPVTLVEFADLKCPFCREFSVSAYPAIVDEYVKTGKVKMVLQLQTFVAEQITPGDSRNAATMAEASGLQNKLWNFADLWYANQKEESEIAATDEWLREIGGAIPGLDVEKAMADRDSETVNTRLTEASDAFTEGGFTGTPSFQIGLTGKPLEELVYTSLDKPDDFKTAIDLLLTESE